jgi:DNA-binding MarR family transcriptional regulator
MDGLMSEAAKDPKITAATLRVLALFLESNPSPLAGSDIFNRTKMFSGTLYPILSRLEKARWLSADWENVDPSEAGRPRRRFYTLTSLGRRRAIAELEAFQMPVGRRATPTRQGRVS